MDKPNDKNYHPAAFEAALDLIRRAASEDAAKLIAAIIVARAVGDPAIDLDVLAEFAKPTRNLEAMRGDLEHADAAVARAFGFYLVANRHREFERKRAKGRELLASALGADPSEEESETIEETNVVELSAEFVDLLDQPLPAITSADDLPVVDHATSSWAAIAAATRQHGVRGHHLLLRCADPGQREGADFAGLVAKCGARVVLIDVAGGLSPEGAILKAELHAGAGPVVVVMNKRCLFKEPDAPRNDDDWDAPRSPSTALELEDDRLLAKLSGVRNTYVWRTPATGEVPTDLAAWIGGVIGPMGFAKGWRESIIAGMAPGIGSVGTKALLSRVRDPRDAGSLAAMAVSAASTGLDLDAACQLVCRSLTGETAPRPSPPPFFDPRLIVCDEEGRLLLERAPDIARNGGRVLLWGPPGGGKSTYAQALAAAMGGGRIARVVTPSAILARAWGATERLLADLWARASADDATLIIDELDSMCGVRESGSPSGNAYLIRTLTDEWLRHFDGNPSVPVIATVNDVLAIDDAVRRRFAFVVEVRDELPPEGEVLAWASMFQTEPPAGWTPCGASVSDFAIAAARCKMLGLAEADALAAAVVRARDARRGPGGSRKGLVH